MSPYSCRKQWGAALVLLALLVLCPWSKASASTMYSFDSPNFYGNHYYLPQTLGNVFTPAANLTVTSLGVFDYQDNGLGEAHGVGIFDQAGTLLASTVISAGTASPLVYHFRYADIAPLSLTAGQTYTVAALYLTLSDVIGYASIGEVAADPAIGLPGFAARYAIGSTAMAFPTGTVLASAPFYIGPNFQFTVDQPPASLSMSLLSGADPPDPPDVPIPGTVWLLGSGLAGLSLWRRTRA